MNRMSQAAIAALAISGLSGCQNTSVQAVAVAPQANAAPAFPVPKWDMTDRLGLIADDGALVKVGDTGEVFRTHFPRPATLARSLTGDDIPMDVPQDTHWSVTGYDYENASRGAGALLYDNRVATAMRQLESVQEKDVQAEVSKYTGQFSTPRTVFGARVSYWFWEVPPVRLMICSFKTNQGAYNMTTTIADDDVGEKLGISPDIAATSKDTLEHLSTTSGNSTAPQ